MENGHLQVYHFLSAQAACKLPLLQTSKSYDTMGPRTAWGSRDVL